MAETKKVAKASSRAGSAAADEALPSREEAVAAFSSALAPGLERARSRLSALADRPPQLLHVEGGELNERVGLALWWAALLNCANTEEAGALQPEPCLACSACLRIGAGLFADLVILDGREGNIKIDQVREPASAAGGSSAFRPQACGRCAGGSGPWRGGCQLSVEISGRAVPGQLLSVYHAAARTPASHPGVARVGLDPCPGRIRRVLCRNLSGTGHQPLRSLRIPARGWFERTSVKGAVDAVLAQNIVLAGQKALAERLTGKGSSGWPGRSDVCRRVWCPLRMSCSLCARKRFRPRSTLLWSWSHGDRNCIC